MRTRAVKTKAAESALVHLPKKKAALVHSASVRLVAPPGVVAAELPPARMVTADPPWPYDLDVRGRGASKKYKTMQLEAIRNLELPPIDDDSMLAMWVVGGFAEESYGVMRAWGFEYCHAELVWNKYRRCVPCRGAGVLRTGREKLLGPCLQCGGRGQFRMTGMGWTTAWSHERAIFGVRGKGRKARLQAGIQSAFDALMPTTLEGRLVHSAKPHEFYERVARLFPGPRIALFERHHRPGYVCFGDELPPVIGEHEFENASDVSDGGGT